MTRNYDYLPDDPAALRAEIAALDSRIVEMEETHAAAIDAAVAEETERLQYIARTAILAGYSQMDDDRPPGWFADELKRLQEMLDPPDSRSPGAA